MVHEYSINTWISICLFSIYEKFGMDITWTLQPGRTIEVEAPHQSSLTCRIFPWKSRMMLNDALYRIPKLLLRRENLLLICLY